MAKVIFTSKPDSGYDDNRADRYHFPRRYLNYVEAAVGDLFIYYEPKRKSASNPNLGGRVSYVATGKIEKIDPDPVLPDHFYARISNFFYFDQPVPLHDDDRYYESRIRKADGTPNKGLLGWAVRQIPEDEFDQILTVGFTQVLDADASATPRGFEEEQEPFQRRMIDQLVTRPWRDRKFSQQVRRVYDSTCALTGLKIINGGGVPEIEAAHIRPVGSGHGGNDSVRNGIALCRTAHWLFDRGLVTLREDYSIGIARQIAGNPVTKLFRPNGQAIVPIDPNFRPGLSYLKDHWSRFPEKDYVALSSIQ